MGWPLKLRKSERRIAVARASEVEPVLGFGGVLDAGKLIHGGAVKLLSLRDGFATDENKFNVLYLVSSAQPQFPDDWVAACREQRIAVVWNQNGVGYPAWAGWQAERHNRPMRKLRAAADFVIYQSEFCRASAERFLGASDRPSRTLLNPVDTEKFSPSDVFPPVEPLRLLVMGTQNYAARVLNVLEALDVLRKAGQAVRLTVAGNAIWRNAEREISQKIRSFGLEGLVERRPAFNREEAVQLYQSHHILVHAKYMDPCPTVVAEALASGLPVVASDSGGLPEMTIPECARLIGVPTDWKKMHTPTGEELAAAVLDLAKDLTSASRAARAHALQIFDQQTWIAEHGKIFRNLLRNL